MIRVEVLAFGRIARMTLAGWSWAVRVRRCAGVWMLDVGPVEVVAYTRRMWWEQPW